MFTSFLKNLFVSGLFGIGVGLNVLNEYNEYNNLSNDNEYNLSIDNFVFLFMSWGFVFTMSMLVYFDYKFTNGKDNDNLKSNLEKIEKKNNSKILFLVDEYWENKKDLPDYIRKRTISIESENDDDFFKWLNRNNPFYERNLDNYETDSESESESFSISESWSDSESYTDYDNLSRLSEQHYDEKPVYKKLQLIIHTNGGSSATADMISNILLNYPGETECYIPFYGFSAGSFIALSCDKIYMHKFAMIGPTDPQVSYQLDKNNSEMYPSNSYLSIYEEKDINKISDKMLLKIYNSKVFHEDNEISLRNILKNKCYDSTVIENIVDNFGSGKYPHFKPYNIDQLKRLGLDIEDEFNYDVYKLFKSYLREIKEYENKFSK